MVNDDICAVCRGGGHGLCGGDDDCPCPTCAARNTSRKSQSSRNREGSGSGSVSGAVTATRSTSRRPTRRTHPNPSARKGDHPRLGSSTLGVTDQQRVESLLLDGAPLSQIARDVGCTRDQARTIRARLERQGTTIPTETHGRPPALTPPQRRLGMAFRKLGMAYGDIGRLMGVAHTTVSRSIGGPHGSGSP